MGHAVPLLWLALGVWGCSDPGPFLTGRVLIDPCGPGPDAQHCTDTSEDLDCRRTHGSARPAPGASITIAQKDLETVADDQGWFLFTGLPPGTYALSAALADTVEVRTAQVVEVLPHRVDDDHAQGPLELHFTAAGTLAGRVHPPASPSLDLEDAIELVEVHLACPPRTAVTDAEGRFRFEGVPQGTRLVSAVGVGLVGTHPPVEVVRGRTTSIDVPLAVGRPPEAPGNRPPTITSDLLVSRVTNGADRRVRPPFDTYVRGDRLLLTCEAEDPDGDPLQVVWTASSGELTAGSTPSAVLTAGKSDIGVSCTVLDGRGGIDSRHRVLEVRDPYYAGATLTDSGVLAAVAYGSDFDLFFWSPNDVQRVARTGPQWLPRGWKNRFAYVDRASGVDVLWVATHTPEADPPLAGYAVDVEVRHFAAFGHGVSWVDTLDMARWVDASGNIHELGGPYAGGIAGSHEGVAIGRSTDEVDVFHLQDGALQLSVTLSTPGRTGPALGTDGARVVYWGGGRPMLSSTDGVVPLGPDEIGVDRGGRVAMTPLAAAYSYYESPLRFVEATVVPLTDGEPGPRHRPAIGPSEVLALDETRLLLGRPRANEAEPSADLWIVDVTDLGAVP